MRLALSAIWPRNATAMTPLAPKIAGSQLRPEQRCVLDDDQLRQPATPQSQTHRDRPAQSLRHRGSRPAGQLACGSDDAGIAVAPIMTIAGVGARDTTLTYKHGPVAIMLDLMNPVSAFGRLVGQTWKLRRDKSKAGEAGHALF